MALDARDGSDDTVTDQSRSGRPRPTAAGGTGDAAWILEHLADAHVTLDGEFRFLYVNAAAEQALGKSRDEMLGRTHWEVFPTSADDDAGRAYRRVVAEGIEQHLTQHDVGVGHDRHLAIDAYPTAEGGVAVFWRDVTARVATEAALRDRETRLAGQARQLAAITENATLALFVMDEQQRCTYMNPAAERLTGFTLDELQGQALHYHVHHTRPDGSTYPLEECPIDQALPQNMREQGTEVFVHKDGSFYEVAFTASPIRDGETGRALGTVIEVRDIREERSRERERERLHRSLEVERSRLAAVFAQTPSMLAIVRGREHVLVMANDAYLALIGHRDVLGKALFEAVPELRGQGLEALLDRVVATGEPYVGREIPVRVSNTPGAPPEERFFDFVYLPLVEADGTRAGVIAHGSDVTEQVLARREVERLLAESEHARADAERARRETAGILSAASDGILGVDREGRTTFANPAAERMLGWTAAELVGRPQHALVHHTRADGSAYPAAECALFRAVRDGIGGRVDDEVFWRKDGTSFPVEYAMTPLTESGVVVGAVVTFHDVSARRESDAERARLLASERIARAAAEAAQGRAEAAGREAAEANQAKSRFLATMSHELRTPINAMIGYTQLLELGLAGPLTEQQRGYLERMQRSSQHLLGLVNDVLDLSRIEAGETRVAHTEAWSGAATQTALDLVRPQADAKGVRLVDARPSEAGVPYVGDEDRVRQILVNLLGNAVKFTPAGGTVTAACGRVAETPAAPGHLHGAGPWAYVRVTDTGIGIPPEEQGRIFEPFHQVADANAYTRTESGTGLGLAISRQLARLMGGDLTVESVHGQGSTFTLWLPSARRAADALADGQAREKSKGAGETAADRGAHAARDLGQLMAPGLAAVGEVLRGAIDDVLAAYAERLRADPAIPRGRELGRLQLEDHAVSLLADLAQSLVIVDEAGPEAADLLVDGSAIQRTVAEQHGARRQAQGWDAVAVRRDHRIFREEVERAVRTGLRADSSDVDAAVQILLRLVDRAEAISVRSWYEAAYQAGSAGATTAPGSTPAAGDAPGDAPPGA